MTDKTADRQNKLKMDVMKYRMNRMNRTIDIITESSTNN